MADKGGFRHFMLKEIFEQPRAVRDTFLPRIAPATGKISLDAANISETEFGSLAKINIAASGSSRHVVSKGARFRRESCRHHWPRLHLPHRLNCLCLS